MRLLEKKNRGIFMGVAALAVFLVLCLVELKAIYWGGLDKATVFSPINIAVFILYFLVCGLPLLAVLLILFSPGGLSSLKSKINALGSVKWILALLLGFYPVWLFSACFF